MDYRLEQFRFELREDPSSRIFFKLGEHLRREGELQEAIAVLGNGLEQHPKYVAAWVSLGRALLDAGSGRQAADALGRALALDPENAVASRHAGEAAIANGEWVEAIKSLKRARALSAPDEALDERIQFVEGHLAEMGQLEAPPPAAKLGSGWVAPPSTGRSLDQVFAEPEKESAADTPGDDVFFGDSTDETAGEGEVSGEYDSRATMAIPLAEMSIPSAQVEDFERQPIEPEPEPAFEVEPESDDQPIIESPAAADPEPVFDIQDEPASVIAPTLEDIVISDLESDTVPLSVPEIVTPSVAEVEFEFDVEEDAEPDVHSEELPLPTMTLARLALDQGDLELAEQTLRGVLERDPSHSEANELLAGLAGGAGPAPQDDRVADETGGARAKALRRWLDAVRLASERLKP